MRATFAFTKFRAAAGCDTGAAAISRRHRTSSAIIGRALAIDGRSSTTAKEAQTAQGQNKWEMSNATCPQQ